MKIKRRDFFKELRNKSVLIFLPSVLVSFLESCSNSSNPVQTRLGGSSALPTINGTYQNGVVSIDLNSSSPLTDVGGAALVKYNNSHLLVDKANTNSFNALSAICTHQGCLIDSYDSKSEEFVCTCHGSKYNLSGSVVQGPAGSALKSYSTTYANNQLDIQVG